MPPEDVKFLLVDDLEENLFALEALLRRDGLQLFRAKSGPEALELLLKHDFALALLDVQMDGMDGFELAELMRGTGRTRHVPIIFLTAVATDERRHFRGYEAGAVDFLFKPLDSHMLTSKAGVFFDLARQRQELARQRDDIRSGAEKLEAALSRQRAHADNSPLALIELDAGFRITDWSLGAERIFGWSRSEMLGRGPRDAEWLHAEGTPALEALEAALLAGDAPRAVRDIRLRRKDGTVADCEWYCSALRGADGALVSVSAQVLDITERRRAEATQRLLIGELNHRVKNMLATVQAIASQGLRRGADPADFVADFSGRIQALARAHSLLSDSTWQGAMLKELVDGQLQLGTIAAGRLSVSGADLRLAPQVALHMGLILHELTTNANKYGALSTEGGRVALDWHVADHVLHLRWSERGGPPVTPPRRVGFGTTLIEQSVGAEGGSAEANYATEGLTWHIAMPLHGEEAPKPIRPPAPPEKAPKPAHANGTPEASLAGCRLLVIEDEPIIALQMATTLEQAGAKVVGTPGTIEQALKAIETLALDGALLDGNLRGLAVGEVAAVLAKRGIPFAFVTGYGREHLPAGFPEAGILTKPFSSEALLDVAMKLRLATNNFTA